MLEMVVFLGNVGPHYAFNRHNSGWLLAARLPFYDSLAWQKKFKGVYAGLDYGALVSYGNSAFAEAPPANRENPDLKHRVHFFMPHTFMNLSGEAVHPAAAFFKIPPERVIVVHDELELPLGTVSLKFSGGLGGHNGLRSVKARFGSPDFWRLRIGIGRPAHSDIASWVLDDFTKQEENILNPVLEGAASGLLRALLWGPSSLLPEWNKKKIDSVSQNVSNGEI